MHEFATEQNLTPLLETHLVFLKEYTVCLKPVAITLDKLQGEANIFLGDLIPCILNAEYNLKQIDKSKLKYCAGLVDVLLKSLGKR